LILLSLGTHEQPFPRALDVVAPLSVDEPLVIQHGSTTPDPATHNTEWVEFLPPAALRAHIARSSVTIVHGGVGSILLALQAGRVPVVVPRLARFGEHVDDHQVEIAQSLSARGLAVSCLPRDDIHEAVRAAAAARGRSIGVGRELQRALLEETMTGATARSGQP
jgi:UDP-N-acetylglucosamine--N-acetylmuramyl-(pentapeptide) pyrophosphoryl-undecaprenol N-acetylglucosamine transferase